MAKQAKVAGPSRYRCAQAAITQNVSLHKPAGTTVRGLVRNDRTNVGRPCPEAALPHTCDSPGGRAQRYVVLPRGRYLCELRYGGRCNC